MSNPLCDEGCVMQVCVKCGVQFRCEHEPCDCEKKAVLE